MLGSIQKYFASYGTIAFILFFGAKLAENGCLDICAEIINGELFLVNRIMLNFISDISTFTVYGAAVC